MLDDKSNSNELTSMNVSNVTCVLSGLTPEIVKMVNGQFCTNSFITRSKTSTFGLTYCQIEILQIRKKQNIKNKRTAHLQHSAVQFSTSTFAVHYSTIQYQHICSTVLNIYSTFQVTCTFAAHYSTIQHQYISSTLH